MRRAGRVVVAAAAAAALALPAAGGRPGEAESGLLQIAPGVRAAGLGGAGVAVADDANALGRNPAGLAWNAAENLAADHAEHFLDLDADHVAYAHPTSDRSTWGVSLSRLGASGIERTAIGPGGAPLTGLGTFEAEETLLSTGFAYLVRPDLALGVAGKVLRQRFDGESEEAVAFDVGARYQSALAGVDLAVAVRNIGREGARGGDLPTTVHLGASYGRIVGKGHYLVLAAETAFGRDRPPTIRLGGETWLFGLVALRAGFDEALREAEGGLTLGLGVRYRGLALDYAFLPTDDLGNVHRVGLSVAFGRERARPAGRYDPASWGRRAPP